MKSIFVMFPNLDTPRKIIKRTKVEKCSKHLILLQLSGVLTNINIEYYLVSGKT